MRHAHSGKETAFDDSCQPGVQLLESSERGIHGDHIVDAGIDANYDVFGRKARAAIAFPCLACQGIVDEHATHRLGRDREKMRAVAPDHVVEAGQLDVGLVDERGRIQRGRNRGRAGPLTGNR